MKDESDSSLSPESSENEETVEDNNYLSPLQKETADEQLKKEYNQDRDSIKVVGASKSLDKLVTNLKQLKKSQLLTLVKVFKSVSKARIDRTRLTRDKIRYLSENRNLLKLSVNIRQSEKSVKEKLLHIWRFDEGRIFRLALRSFYWRKNHV